MAITVLISYTKYDLLHYQIFILMVCLCHWHAQLRKCIFRSVVRYKSTTYSYQYKNIGLKSENIKNIFEMLQKISEKTIIY